MDLQRIQTRLDKGVYSECSAKFWRDLLLFFNNLIVFHHKSSPERIAAQQLRALVLKEMTHMLPKQSETDDGAKPKESSTIVACGKRRSSKAVTKNTRRGDEKERGVEQKKVDGSCTIAIDDMGIRKKRSKERVVSGRRNSLRTSSTSEETKHEYGGNELSSHDAVEMKVDNKKENNNNNNNNKARKKQGAASFLKRMKQNSPSEVTEKDEDDDDDSEDENKDEKEKGRVERVTRSSGGRRARSKRGVGRPPKVVAESTGKRGRDNVENEVGLGGTGRARKRGRR